VSDLKKKLDGFISQKLIKKAKTRKKIWSNHAMRRQFLDLLKEDNAGRDGPKNEALLRLQPAL
jgi:hypothetical protein